MSTRKQILMIGAALSIYAAPAIGQTATTDPAVTDVGTTLPAEDDDGDEGKWGLAGLLGLLGLMGLKRRDRDDSYRDTTATGTTTRR